MVQKYDHKSYGNLQLCTPAFKSLDLIPAVKEAQTLWPIIPPQAFLQEQLSYQDAKYPHELSDLMGWQPDETQLVLPCMPHCCEPSERPPPTTKGEVRPQPGSGGVKLGDHGGF